MHTYKQIQYIIMTTQTYYKPPFCTTCVRCAGTKTVLTSCAEALRAVRRDRSCTVVLRAVRRDWGRSRHYTLCSV